GRPPAPRHRQGRGRSLQGPRSRPPRQVGSPLRRRPRIHHQPDQVREPRPPPLESHARAPLPRRARTPPGRRTHPRTRPKTAVLRFQDPGIANSPFAILLRCQPSSVNHPSPICHLSSRIRPPHHPPPPTILLLLCYYFATTYFSYLSLDHMSFT